MYLFTILPNTQNNRAGNTFSKQKNKFENTRRMINVDLKCIIIDEMY